MRSVIVETALRVSLATCAEKESASSDPIHVQKGLMSTLDGMIVGARVLQTSAVTAKCAMISVPTHHLTVHRLLWPRQTVLVFAVGRKRRR